MRWRRGSPPFDGDDALEVIHGHLARAPIPVTSVKPAIPSGLAGIIERLLAKDLDQRDQTAGGVEADLETGLFELRRAGDVAAFALGTHDGPRRFSVPDALYGRDKDIERLLAAFERACHG